MRFYVPAISVYKLWDIKSLTLRLKKRLNSRLLPHHLSTPWYTCIILIHVLLGSGVFCYSYSKTGKDTANKQWRYKSKKKWPHCKQNNCKCVLSWIIPSWILETLYTRNRDTKSQSSTVCREVQIVLPTRKTWLALSLSVESSGLSTGVWLVNLESNWLASSADCCQKKQVC